MSISLFCRIAWSISAPSPKL